MDAIIMMQRMTKGINPCRGLIDILGDLLRIVGINYSLGNNSVICAICKLESMRFFEP